MPLLITLVAAQQSLGAALVHGPPAPGAGPHPVTGADRAALPSLPETSRTIPPAAFGGFVVLAEAPASGSFSLPAGAPARVPANADGSPNASPDPPAAGPGSGTAVTVPLPGKGGDQPRVLPRPQAQANPFGRDIDLTVNADFFGRDLGELPVHMAADGKVSLDSAELVEVLGPLLSDAAKQKLVADLTGRPSIDPAALRDFGVDAAFDPSTVSVQISRIEPAMRRPVSLYQSPVDRSAEEVNAFPAKVSGYLNVNVAQSRLWNGARAGFRKPSVFLASAVRAGPIVVEGDGQFADANQGLAESDYRFDRNFVRLVYDLPKRFTRIYGGDLTPETRFQQSYVQMGGVGLSRQRRRFDQFRGAVLQGNRQLLLQRESTVDVFRNGVLYQQLQLAPGSYDLGSLPLTTGSNDISLRVQGLDGTSQTIQYQAYFDPIDLDPGDYEIGAYLGKMSTSFGLSPKYDGEMAFTGFFRKAFLNHPAIGVGVQASKSVQQFSAQTQLLMGWGGRLDITGAFSRGKLGKGYLLGASYDLSIDRGAQSDTVTVQAIYQSRYFTGIGSPFQENSNALTVTAAYSRTFSPKVNAQIGASYVHNRRPLRDDFRIYADAYYRIGRRWSFRAGADYQRLGQGGGPSRGGGFGFLVGLVFLPNDRDRAEARYEYRQDRAELSFDHASGSHVGAVGYGGVVSRSPENTSASGAVSYIANRFDAGLRHSMVGEDFGKIADRQVTTLRAGTAIAFAGGSVAIGRRVSDSFAILVPHKTLKGRPVISGQSLSDGHYRGKSGTFGGAVNGYLSSYVTQSVQYDVQDPPAGYDLGSGVFRVSPPYHSGYRLVVGTDAFVTAAGTLTDAKGAPVKLASGQMLDLADAKAKPQAFFTSSAGRFALAALKPGGRYRVQLSSGGYFAFTVPAETDGFLDMRTIQLPAPR